MDRERQEAFRKQLLETRQEISGDAAARTHDGFSLGQDGNQDVGDDAANISARQVLLGLGDRERKLLRLIDEALDRIDDGSFGFCEECGVKIGAARLQVLPYARLCVECKAIQEQLLRR